MVAKLSKAWSLPEELLSAPYAVSGGVKRAVTRGAAALALMMTIGLCGTGGLLWTYGRDLPDTSALAAYTPPDITRFGPDGQLAELRKFVPLSGIPPHVVKAFLAAEDEDYYGHKGYSLAAILRAAAQNVREGSARKRPAGGATITQQLAKNIFLAGQPPSSTQGEGDCARAPDRGA
jgi:penicillin-binding protein 1A